jgi:hypothetical protein
MSQTVAEFEVSATSPDGVASIPPDQVRRDTIVWQRDLLPFMTHFVVTMAVAFFLFSGFHVYEVTRYIEEDQHQSILAGVQAEISRPLSMPLTSTDLNNNALILLEAATLDRRYHQAGGMLMSRIWARQLTFITGMVLAFVGAVFILGKLTESSSQFTGGTAQMKLAVTSASPGLILSFFGTSLIMASLFVASNLDVADGAAYVNRMQPVRQPQNAPATANPATAPPSLEELQRMQSNGKKKQTK